LAPGVLGEKMRMTQAGALTYDGSGAPALVQRVRDQGQREGHERDGSEGAESHAYDAGKVMHRKNIGTRCVRDNRMALHALRCLKRELAQLWAHKNELGRDGLGRSGVHTASYRHTAPLALAPAASRTANLRERGTICG
jgi:hypothetical protein